MDPLEAGACGDEDWHNMSEAAVVNLHLRSEDPRVPSSSCFPVSIKACWMNPAVLRGKSSL